MSYREPSLEVHMLESQEPKLSTVLSPSKYLGLKPCQWWFLVALNIVFLLVGQSASTLLGRFYYDQGGNSKWMATLVQTVAFPILYIPFFFIPSSPKSSSPSTEKTSLTKICLIYVALGLLVAGDNMLYSIGLLYLPVSTYALLCATQLAFNAIFSYLINAQKFTALVINSVIILTLSASLLAVREGSSDDSPTGVSKGKYVLGFISTLSASAFYSLLLSLMQYTFEKVLKKQTFAVVLEMQIYTSVVASCACVVGLFASGEWSGLTAEMNGFEKGRASYVMTLVGTAVSWQICSVGVVGLIFIVSSLFSNVISTFALPLLPIAAVITFHDKMDGVKVVAMLMAIWGTASYIYQHYLDDIKLRAARSNTIEVSLTGNASELQQLLEEDSFVLHRVPSVSAKVDAECSVIITELISSCKKCAEDTML